jgi:hypothetical protein
MAGRNQFTRLDDLGTVTRGDQLLRFDDVHGVFFE